MKIRALVDADRRGAARIYVGALFDEEVRPLMPSHLDQAEGVFAELIQANSNSWVAESDGGELIGLALSQETCATPPRMTSWKVYRHRLPLMAAIRAKVIANYLYRVRFPEDTMYLQSLAVTRDWEGQGVGHALVDCVCRVAQERGYAKVTLNVVEGNDRALRLYEHLGFSKGQTTPTGFYQRFVGWSAVHAMEKRLVPKGDPGG